jgi:hypothetical protein
VSDMADALSVGPGPIVAQIGVVPPLSLLRRVGDTIVGIALNLLAIAQRGADFASLVPVSTATFTWTTQVGALITHAAAKCVITLPNAGDVVSWPVGEARTLAVGNTGGFGIGFAAVSTVGFNYMAVNTQIATLPGSNVVPSATVLPPVYTVYRASASSYLITIGA